MDQDEIPYSEWPLCPVKGCENHICLRLGSDFCFPHTTGKHTREILKEILPEKVDA